MAFVSHEWAPTEGHTGLFQADGTVTWQWTRGDEAHYWAFCVRPRQANSTVEVLRQRTVSNNDLVQTEFFDVTMTTPNGGGGLLQFNVIRVEGP